jgi:hypothetical protein
VVVEFSLSGRRRRTQSAPHNFGRNTMAELAKEVIRVNIEDEKSYLDYAMR